MFGVETEYAMSAFGPDGEPASREDCIDYLIGRAGLTLPHVCGVSSADLFLANGTRLYVDAGQHPEMSSPEVLNPWDAVRYAKAGDLKQGRSTLQAALKLNSKVPEAQIAQDVVRESR